MVPYFSRTNLLHGHQNQWKLKEDIFKQLEQELGCSFTIDLTAKDKTMAMCPTYFNDCLLQLREEKLDWSKEIGWCNPPYMPATNAKYLIQRIALKTSQVGLLCFLLIPDFLLDRSFMDVKKTFPQGTQLFIGDNKQVQTETKWPTYVCQIKNNTNDIMDSMDLRPALEETEGHDDFCHKCRKIANDVTLAQTSFCECEGCTHSCCLECLHWDNADTLDEYWCEYCRDGLPAPVKELASVYQYLLLTKTNCLVRGYEQNKRLIYPVELDSDLCDAIIQANQPIAYTGNKVYFTDMGIPECLLQHWKLRVKPGFDTLDVLQQHKYRKDEAVSNMLTKLA
jgi:hypothetical protein